MGIDSYDKSPALPGLNWICLNTTINAVSGQTVSQYYYNDILQNSVQHIPLTFLCLIYVLADITGLKKQEKTLLSGWQGKSRVCRQLFYSQSQGQ